MTRDRRPLESSRRRTLFLLDDREPEEDAHDRGADAEGDARRAEEADVAF
jgi:hypothetical protein